MSLVSSCMVEALFNRKHKTCSGNTRVIVDDGVATALLFGNPILRYDGKSIWIGTCGWSSVTTMERINAWLGSLYGRTRSPLSVCRVSSNNGTAYLHARYRGVTICVEVPSTLTRIEEILEQHIAECCLDSRNIEGVLLLGSPVAEMSRHEQRMEFRGATKETGQLVITSNQRYELGVSTWT